MIEIAAAIACLVAGVVVVWAYVTNVDSWMD